MAASPALSARRIAAERILAAGLLALACTEGRAHSGLVETIPADGAILAKAPATVVLAFTGRIRLTRVRMTHEDDSAVALDLGERKTFATRFAIPLRGKGKGRYRIEWRGLAIDGHAMRGSFAFRVR